MYNPIPIFVAFLIFTTGFVAAGAPSKIYGVNLGSWSVSTLVSLSFCRDNTDFGVYRLVLESWMLPAGKLTFL